MKNWFHDLFFFGAIIVDNPDVNQLSDFFFEAAETERALPPAIRKQKLGSWPEYAQQWSAYGSVEFAPKLPAPSPQQVSRYTKALYLGIEHMDEDDRKLIWAVSHSAAYRERGAQWQKLARMHGLRDGRQIKRRYTDAIVRLWAKLRYEEEEILAKYF